jgi:hypothetical protein
MNVAEGIKRFCETEWPKHVAENESDIATIKAFHNRQFDGDRLALVGEWLRSYQVFQGLDGRQRKALARNLVYFYDSKRRNRIRSTAHLLSEFHELESSLREGAMLVTKRGLPRKIESLASKALWCCYPFDVPILDSFAENALRVIARSLGLSIGASDSRYEQFVGLWFKLYETVQPQIIEFAMSNSAYPIRVFDRYLWWLGRTSYDGLVVV